MLSELFNISNILENACAVVSYSLLLLFTTVIQASWHNFSNPTALNSHFCLSLQSMILSRLQSGVS